MNFELKKIPILILTLIVCFSLSSCGPFRFERADVKDSPINEADKRKRNIEEGRGFTLPIGKNSNGAGNFSFANSNELWRATLDVLEFAPLSNVDYGGGIIITDWYSSDSSIDKSIKISIQFLSDEIRADGLVVKIYQKNCITNSNCSIKLTETDLNQEIKLAILKRAAILEKGLFSKNAKEYGRKKRTTLKDK